MKTTVLNTSAIAFLCILTSGISYAITPADNASGADDSTAKTVKNPAEDATPKAPVPSQQTDVKAPVTWTEVRLYPEQILLSGKADYQGVVAVAVRSDGVTKDVTEEVKFQFADATIATVEGLSIKPLVGGQTKLTAAWQGLAASSEVTVASPDEARPISFHLDVMPVLTRTGCNTGSCHGAARGKDGFRLSLFGFDPVGDHERITREIGIRRINLARPEQSLIYLKGIGGVPHSGGKRMEPASEYAETLLAWLEADAKLDEGEPPTCTQVELFPPEAVLEGDEATQRMVAVAHYSDGTTRDVTTLAAFTTNNARTADVDDLGRVSAGVRGEAFVMARFDTHTVGSQILALPAGLEYTPPTITGNYIDSLVGEKQKKLRILPSELCSDEEFLRRATIDIAGKLPTEQEYAAFVNDASKSKRAQLIDRLLERKEFSEIWAMKWAQLLLVKSNNQVSYKAAFLYSSWLTNALATDTPIDQIVRDLIASNGGVFERPATNFYQVERDTLKTSENVAQVFMGIRTQCAQCHNHPFDRWTMDDYYGFASFFSQIGRKTGEDYREIIVYNRGGGEVNHPVTKKPVPATYLGGETADTKGRDRREALAEWLTSKENPFFAKSIANRVWAHFMGVGIVDPVDDIRVSNPASNPALFAELGNRFASYDFDLKQLVRDICNSQAYQRSTIPNKTNELDTRNYAFAMPRRVPAEMLLDCISQATSTQDKFRGLPAGARAVQIADGATSNYFLTTFGRSPRTTVCECEASTDPSLSQALHLINGSTTAGKIAQGKLVNSWIDQELTVPQMIEKIYIRCLSRKPTEDETNRLTKLVGESGSVPLGVEDVFWAVLNSREFMFNH